MGYILNMWVCTLLLVVWVAWYSCKIWPMEEKWLLLFEQLWMITVTYYSTGSYYQHEILLHIQYNFQLQSCTPVRTDNTTESSLLSMVRWLPLVLTSSPLPLPPKPLLQTPNCLLLNLRQQWRWLPCRCVCVCVCVHTYACVIHPKGQASPTWGHGWYSAASDRLITMTM